MPPRLRLRLITSPPSTLNSTANSSLRAFSTTQLGRASAPTEDSTSARWLSETKARIGKCIMFGLDEEQTRRAGSVLKELGTGWRQLVAGREGFLVERKRAGLLRQKVVWGEMDSMNHVNNVTYIRYAESARVNWAHNYAVHIDPQNRAKWSELWTPRGDGMILKSIETAFKFPMTWPDHISVFHKLASLPDSTDSSFVLDVMILSERHQRPAARCVEHIVTYDYRIGRKTEIRPFMMDAFEETWEMQEKAKESVDKKIMKLDALVRGLEKSTWDAPGAVEDMGSRGQVRELEE